MRLSSGGSFQIALLGGGVYWGVCDGCWVGVVLLRSESYMLEGLSCFQFIAKSILIFFPRCRSLLRRVRLQVGPMPDHFSKEDFSKDDQKHHQIVES